MFEKYINWEDVAVRTLRRHNDNLVALTNLREEYLAITDGLGAVDYARDRVDSSGDGDSAVINRLFHREALESKIKALEHEERQYGRAWAALTDDERRILTEFFQRGRRRAEDAADAICDYYDCDRSTAFRKRKNAIERFRRLLVG